MSVKITVDIDDDLVVEIHRIQRAEGKTFEQVAMELLLKGFESFEIEHSNVCVDSSSRRSW
jgi:hypothetical protein